MIKHIYIITSQKHSISWFPRANNYLHGVGNATGCGEYRGYGAGAGEVKQGYTNGLGYGWSKD